MAIKPLDPDTMARMEQALSGRHLSPNVLIPRSKLTALLAVARDHARLTAENEALRKFTDWL
jgi:hypothetical protein